MSLIKRKEVEHALESSKTERALRRDEIPIVVFKLLTEDRSLYLLVDLFNNI